MKKMAHRKCPVRRGPEKQLPVSVACFVCLVLLGEVRVASGTLTFEPFNPTTVTISETTRNIQRLDGRVRCTETDATKICTCTVISSVPFETWWLSGDASFYVYYDNSAKLSPSTYPVEVECRSNNKGIAIKQILTVTITRNKPPVITNYNTDAASVDAKSSRQYDVVYTTLVTDPEGDAIIYNMSVTPNLGHFIIGAGNGKVYTTIDLRSATVDKYTLTIAVNDGFNVVKDFVVTLTLTNRNTAPQITNLPDTVVVKETAKKGDVVITLILDDTDVYTTLDPVCVTKDAADMKKFTFDMPNNQIKLAYDNALDFETKPNISITCTWCDGFLCSANEVLTVSAQNLNEEPVWSDKMFFCSIDEGIAGGPTCSLRAVLKDPENGPMTVEVVTTNNLKFFKYDYSTDTMSFTVDYDLDQAGYDSDVTAIMTATDNKGLTSTATVKIHVNDINDNKCKTDSLRTFDLDETDPLQKLGMLPYSDADATSPNNVVHFEVGSATPSTAQDSITVTRNGEIYYTNLIGSALSTINMKFIVYCVDEGIPRQTATATVLVNFLVPTTTLVVTTFTSTTTEKDVWSYAAFQATFGTLMALVGLGLTLLLGSLLACWCARKGSPNWSQLLRPRKPPVEKVLPQLPQATPTPRSMPPVEHPPPVNNRWENWAWSQSDGKPDKPPEGGPTGLFHYH